MASWQALADEAARWCDGGHTAELWWRDDDAEDAGPAADRRVLHRTCNAPYPAGRARPPDARRGVRNVSDPAHIPTPFVKSNTASILPSG